MERRQRGHGGAQHIHGMGALHGGDDVEDRWLQLARG
jgi:hypothetical protein